MWSSLEVLLRSRLEFFTELQVGWANRDKVGYIGVLQNVAKIATFGEIGTRICDVKASPLRWKPYSAWWSCSGIWGGRRQQTRGQRRKPSAYDCPTRIGTKPFSTWLHAVYQRFASITIPFQPFFQTCSRIEVNSGLNLFMCICKTVFKP